MKCEDYRLVEGTEVADPDAKGVTLHIVIGPKEGSQRLVMRVFTVEAGGHTPLHSHPFEHATFFLQGRGKITCKGEITEALPGCTAFIPPGVEHQFANAGDEPLVFICVIPAGI